MFQLNIFVDLEPNLSIKVPSIRCVPMIGQSDSAAPGSIIHRKLSPLATPGPWLAQT